MRRFLLMVLSVALFASSARADVIVTGFAESSIRRYDEVTGAPGAPIIAPGSGTGSGFVAPGGATYGPDGFLYVSCQVSVFAPGSPDFVMKVNPATGAFTPFIALATGYVPAGLRFGPNGNLYVARNGGQGAPAGSGSVDVYNGVSGAFITSAVTSLTQPTGLTFNGNNLYISNFGAGNVIRYDGASSSIFASGGGLAAPSATAFGADGKLYVTDLLLGAVRRYNGTTGAFEDNFVADGGALANQFPADMLFDQLGRLLVANLGFSFNPGDPPNLHGNVMSFSAANGNFLGVFAPDILGASSILLTPIPEPTSLALMGAAAMGGWIRWRRRS